MEKITGTISGYGTYTYTTVRPNSCYENYKRLRNATGNRPSFTERGERRAPSWEDI